MCERNSPTRQTLTLDYDSYQLFFLFHGKRFKHDCPHVVDVVRMFVVTHRTYVSEYVHQLVGSERHPRLRFHVSSGLCFISHLNAGGRA